MTIANVAELVVTTHMTKSDAARLRVKQCVDITLRSNPDEHMEAEISYIGRVPIVLDSASGITVNALIKAPTPRLKHGTKVELIIARES